QRDGSAGGARRQGRKADPLVDLRGKPASEELGIHADQQPAAGLQYPAVLAEVPPVPRQPLIVDRLLEIATPGVVPEVVIARHRAPRDGPPTMAPPREGEIVLAPGAVEADVSGIDDQIGPARGDDRAHRLEVRQEPPAVVPEMRVRDLDDPEGSHAVSIN